MRWLEKAETLGRLAVARAKAGAAMRICRERPLILAYHRILPNASTMLHDEPGVAVTVDTFEAQMDFLRANFVPVALRDIAESVANGRSSLRGAFAVTFDDAWADIANAVPILRRFGIPATVFASAADIASDREFWTRRLLRILSSARNGQRWRSLKNWPRPAALAAKAGIGSRCLRPSPALTWLSSLPASDREEALDELADVCGVPAHVRSTDRMAAEDLRAWLSAGLEVGSHGFEHSCLTNSGPAVLEMEIAQSKRLLEELLRTSISGFAYPYGKVDHSVRAAVAQAGYRYACALERPRGESLDVYVLPRRPVHEGVAADVNERFNSNLFICYLAGVFDRRSQWASS